MTAPDDVVALLRSTVDKIHASARRHTEQLAATRDRVTAVLLDDALAERRDTPPEELATLIARVVATITAGKSLQLRRRDIRIALRHFERLRPGDVRVLLDVAPTLWSAFVRRFFERRLQLADDRLQECIAFVRQAPADVTLLRSRTLDRTALLLARNTDSTRSVAATLSQHTPIIQLLSQMSAPGLLDSRWSYTALVLGYATFTSQRPLGETWAALRAEPRLEAMLLPRRDRYGSSWFGHHTLPTGEGHIDAQAMFAVRLVRTAQVGTSDISDDWRRILFESTEFGDPRTFSSPRDRPETRGWQRVARLAPDDYDAFISSLFAEDVAFFFGNAGLQDDRRAFWLDYIEQATSSMFFLSHGTRATLERKYRGAEPQVRARMSRARPLSEATTDAFALRFGRHVVVEFSITGNASYLYEADAFERVVRQLNSSSRVDALKRKELGGIAQSHIGEWQTRFATALRRRGVFPKRTNGRHHG